jgi:hypothetical protein
MPDPTITTLASGTSTTAVTSIPYTAAAGSLVVLTITGADARVTTGGNRPESSGFTYVNGGVDFTGQYMWFKIATGSETGVNYQIGSANPSAYCLIKADNIEAVPADGSSVLHTHGGSTTSTTAITPTSGRRLVIAAFGGSRAGVSSLAMYPTLTNSFTIQTNGRVTTPDTYINSVGYRVMDGGTSINTTTGAWATNTPACSFGILASFKVTAGGAAVGTGSLSLSGTAGGAAVVGAAGSLSLSGAAGTSSDATATGALALSGAAGAGSTAGGSGSLTLAGTAGGAGVATATGSVSLTGTAGVAGGAAATGSLSLSGEASVGSTATVTAPTATVALSALPPVVTSGATVVVPAVEVTVAAGAPAVSASTVASGGTHAPITITAHAPVVSAGSAAAASATGVLSLSGSASTGIPASGAGLLTLSGVAGLQARAAATGLLTLTGSGGGEGSQPPSATGALTLAGTAGPAVTASASGHLSLAGTVVLFRPPDLMNPRGVIRTSGVRGTIRPNGSGSVRRDYARARIRT